MGENHNKLKALYLLDVFRSQTDEAHRLSVPDLVEALQEMGLETERKALYREIEMLLDYGMDIHKSTGGYYLGERHFTLGELRLLLSAVQAASFISETRSRALMEKLLSELSDYQAESLRRQANIGRVKYGGDEVFTNIERVNLAIAERRRISFFYYKKDISKKNVVQRSGKSYHVSPYAMIWMQDRYYMVANMDSRDDLTHFRLDRMQNVRPLNQAARPCGEVSAYVGRFDAADYARKCLNMFGGTLRRITLRGELRIAGDVLDRFGEDILIKREINEQGEDTHFLAYVQAADGIGLLSYVAQFGRALEIVSPPELRAQMRERLQEACKCYEARDIMPLDGQFE